MRKIAGSDVDAPHQKRRYAPRSRSRSAARVTPSGLKQRPAAEAERAGSEPCAVHRGAARVACTTSCLAYTRHREKLERLASEAGGSAQVGQPRRAAQEWPICARNGRLRKLGTDIDFRRKQQIPKSLINSDQVVDFERTVRAKRCHMVGMALMPATGG